MGTGCVLRPPTRGPLSSGGPVGQFFGEPGVERIPVSEPRFVDSGPAIRREMLDLVREAKDHILLDSFLLNDGPESREILDALAERAAEGVKVRVIGDASSRFVPEEEAFGYLESRGVPVAEFNPVRGWRLLVLPVLLERDHRKFWIVDGREVFFGGANLSDLSLLPPERGGNRDLMVRCESPGAAAMLTSAFVDTWNESEAPFEMTGEEFKILPSHKNPATVDVWFFHQDKVAKRDSPTATMFEGLFSSATETVWLIEPYTFTTPGILSSIRSMTERGVEVNVVLSSQAKAPRFRYASFYGMKDLLKAGAVVWIFDSEVSPLHYKCALIDERLAYVGSANLNLRSMRWSRELNAVFEDRESVAEVGKVIESVRKGCRRVTPGEAAEYRSLPFATWWLIMQLAG